MSLAQQEKSALTLTSDQWCALASSVDEAASTSSTWASSASWDEDLSAYSHLDATPYAAHIVSLAPLDCAAASGETEHLDWELSQVWAAFFAFSSDQRASCRYIPTSNCISVSPELECWFVLGATPCREPVAPEPGSGEVASWRECYETIELPVVNAWLEERPHIEPLLLEAIEPLRHAFPGSRLRLEVVPDPEAAGVRELVLTVASSLGPMEALDAMDAFDRDWWMRNERRSGGDLVIVSGGD